MSILSNGDKKWKIRPADNIIFICTKKTLFPAVVTLSNMMTRESPKAFSIKRNNTEDFPEFFDDRIFKLDKATALTGKDHREIVQTLQRIVKGTGEEVWLDSHHISNKEYNGYIDAYSEESFLKRAEKMRKKAKTTAFPVAGQQDGNLLPAQETERNADEVPAKQLAANAKNAALKKFWHNLKARF